MKPRYPTPGTQADRVLRKLLDANGGWVSKQVFIHELRLTQSGARLFELEELGWPIEHSDFSDEFGFRSYRIATKEPATLSLLSDVTKGK